MLGVQRFEMPVVVACPLPAVGAWAGRRPASASASVVVAVAVAVAVG